MIKLEKRPEPKILIDNAKKFKIPRVETELTKEQLKNYEEQLQDVLFLY